MQNSIEQQEFLDALSEEAKAELFKRFLSSYRPDADMNALLERLLRQILLDFRS